MEWAIYNVLELLNETVQRENTKILASLKGKR